MQRTFYGQQKAQYVIKLKGPYDIGVTAESNGNVTLSTDWWGGSVAKEVGEGYGKLMQLYGVNKAMAEAKRKGLTVTRTVNADGSIRLKVEGQQLRAM
jgi:hypothetical protein